MFFVLSLICYLFSIYVSAHLYDFKLISQDLYRDIYFTGIELTFLLLIVGIANKTKNSLIIDLMTGLFTSRFISQLFFKGQEKELELAIFLLVPTILYYAKLRRQQKIR